MYEKSIQYDRDTRDYAMYLDGELVGFARTYHEAEVTLDQLIFELTNGDLFREALADAPNSAPTHYAPVIRPAVTTCSRCGNNIVASQAYDFDDNGAYHRDSCP
jgi:hypothetical protein